MRTLKLFVLAGFFAAPAFASNLPPLTVEAAKVVQSEPSQGKLVVVVNTQLETHTISNASILPLLRPGDTVLLYDRGPQTEALPTEPVNSARPE